jgi:hypothetical protein
MRSWRRRRRRMRGRCGRRRRRRRPCGGCGCGRWRSRAGRSRRWRGRMLRRCRGGRWRGRVLRRAGRWSCGLLRRRAWRRSLRRLLRSSFGASFVLLRLRDDERRILRMRCGACDLRHRQRSCGKQHKTKVYHDGGPRKGSWLWEGGWGGITGPNASAARSTANPLGRNVAGEKVERHVISSPQWVAHAFIHGSFRRHLQIAISPLLPSRLGGVGCRVGCGRTVRPLRRQLIRHLAGQLVRPRRFAGFVHRRRHLRARVTRRNSRRWFGRRPRCGRWDLGRFIWHLHRHLAIVAEVGTGPGHHRSRHHG